MDYIDRRRVRSADEMRQWAKSTADLLRLGFGAMDEKEARRWSTPPSL